MTTLVSNAAHVSYREIGESTTYRLLRGCGWGAQDAVRAAKATTRFFELEAAGKVRISRVPEEEAHDFSYVDTWGLKPRKARREKEEIARAIERDGLWIYQADIKLPDGWRTVDSLGDCIGDLDHGYRVDLMRAAVEAWEVSFRESDEEEPWRFL